MNCAEIRSRRNAIGAFTELGDYLSMPLRTYSSGMMLRLAFAISTHIDADIILMDEWIGTGDASFTKKAQHQRTVGIAAMSVNGERVFHRRYKGAIGLRRDDPALPAMRLETAFLSVRPVVECIS